MSLPKWKTIFGAFALLNLGAALMVLMLGGFPGASLALAGGFALLALVAHGRHWS